jgi:addiction module RelE/StbE family toxin
LLRIHSLKGKYSGYFSFNVTDDWRALFKIKESRNKLIITFHSIGTHSKLYGK